MKTIMLDIMDAKTGMFICTLRYRYHPIFPLKPEELEEFVLTKRPTLKNRPFKIILYENK